MVAEYVYLFCDILTNEVVLEVPVYGVSFGRLMSKPSDGTLSINLDRTDYSNGEVLGGTVPGKMSVYFERNGTLLWGAILWSRTYQSQAKVLTFTMQTFESYFYKQVIEDSLTFTGKDQRNILCELVLGCTQKPSANVGITLPSNYPFPNDIVRTVTFYDYDTWTFGKAIDYLVEYDQGLDYTIEVAYGEDGKPGRFLRVDNILGASVDNTGLVFEYPGNISNYYWPENASRSATSVIGSGSGDGVDKLMTKAINQLPLNFGYPDLQEVYSNTDVSVSTTLVTQTQEELVRLAPPISFPTIEIDPTQLPELGSWGLGDYATLLIEDARFEGGFVTSVRVIGYDATPPSSDGPETCKLVLEGRDDG